MSATNAATGAAKNAAKNGTTTAANSVVASTTAPAAAPAAIRPVLSTQRAVLVFGAFAFAYFFSALVRAVTATLAPVFSTELGLAAGQLGLLAGAYFLGFSAMQLPLGSALDRWGGKRVLMALLALATLGCLAFAAAGNLPQLLAARLLIGMGVSACLMAPLTCFRLLLSDQAQLRANAWMLMSGSLGMLASTLPVQWLLPALGWRGLFVAVAAMLLLAVGLIWRLVPPDAPASQQARLQAGGYRQVFRHPVFVRLAPLGFFLYGGMIALQALWIGPWLTQVGGRDAAGAARGLFVVNLAMLFAFLAWGLLIPRLVRAGWAGERLIAAAWPLQAGCMGLLLWLGPDAQPLLWALWCVCTSVVSLSQPAVGQAFAPALAGRALSAYNLLIFGGVFAWQWAIGLGLDALAAAGLSAVAGYRLVFGVFLLVCTLACLWLNLLQWRAGGLPRWAPYRPEPRPDNPPPAPKPP